MDDRPQPTRCPFCLHEPEIPAAELGRGVSCPRCERPFTARPLRIWHILEQRAAARLSENGARLDQLENLPSTNPRRRDQLYHQPGGEAPPGWPEARFDTQYEPRRDGSTPSQIVPGLVAVLDDLRSQWNVGSIFRTADGAGWGRLHLCGVTPMPPARGLLRVSLGAEAKLRWDYRVAVLETLRRLSDEGFTLVALEQTDDAVELGRFDPPRRTGLVIGNEVAGVSLEALALCRDRVTIPVAGHKASLNVAVAFGVAAFVLRERWLELHGNGE
jgi:tRNA G18 (ribose-2'-O)-methylase SpoU